MQAGLHAANWGFQRLVIGTGILAASVILGYSLLIFIIVAVQAVAAFGQ